MPCRNCAAPLPDGARFCPQCGTLVATEAPPRRAVRHERRLLTVLFADLVGFTAASDMADPEDVRARVRPFHALVRESVAATGGTVARVVGDGVMAVWGYPLAREDDARRAVDSAIRIRDGLAAAGNDLHARIGVNTGEAVVAFGAQDEDADDAMGDSVNVAARLASSADPDTILIGATTRALVAGTVEVRELEPIRVKGKADPVPVAVVVGEAADPDAARVAGFVGRAAELERILTALRAAECDRRLRRLLIAGEPGIGKSRLVGEVRARVTGSTEERRSWHVGRCRSDSTTPGMALGEIVKHWARIADDDPPETVEARLGQAIHPGVEDRDWLIDRLRPLAGLRSATPSSRDETFLAWARALELLPGDGEAVVVVEDIHWADEELAAFVGSEAMQAIAAPITVLLTGRPEVLSGGTIVAPPADTILLGPLGGDALDALVASAASELALSPAERAAIIARAGGNPLFAVELVRLVAQQGQRDGTDRSAGLPETVQAVISARLDLLDADVRAVLLDAAVVGASFWPGAVAAMDDSRRISIDHALDELARAELVRRRSESTLADEAEYAFRHALVRDVAYAHLTRADRAARHEAAARWLAETAGADRLDLAGVIADHDLRAIELHEAAGTEPSRRLRTHAYRHLLAAGTHAATLDPAAAAERFRQARTVASSARESLDALFGAIRADEERGAYTAELEAIEQASALAAELDDRRAAGWLVARRSAARRPLGDERWISDAEHAVDLLETIPPSPELVEALVERSLVELATFTGTGAGVIKYATRAIEVSTELGTPVPALAYARRGFTLGGDGDPRAFEDMERAVELARAGSSASVQVRVTSDFGGVMVYLGDLAGGERQVRAALALARRRGVAGVVDTMLSNLVYVLRAEGGWDEAVQIAEPTVEAPWPEERFSTFFVRTLELALIRADRGDIDGVRRLLDRMRAGLETGQAVFAYTFGIVESVLGGLTGDADRVLHGLGLMPINEGDEDYDARSTTEYPNVARAALAVGRPEEIDRFIRSINAKAPLAVTTRHLLEGYRAAGSGDHEAAIRLLRAAGDRLASWGFLPEATHARQWLAASQLALGDSAEAEGLLADARSTWIALGANAPLEACDRLLAVRS